LARYGFVRDEDPPEIGTCSSPLLVNCALKRRSAGRGCQKRNSQNCWRKAASITTCPFPVRERSVRRRRTLN